MGRHPTYTPALAATICERISKGEPLEAIGMDDGMPHALTAHDWASADGRQTEAPH